MPKINSETLRNKLKLRHIDSQNRLAAKHPHAVSFFADKGIQLGKIREHSTKLLTAGAISGALLLTPPKTAYAQTDLPLPPPLLAAIEEVSKTGSKQSVKGTKEDLTQGLEQLLSAKPRPLDRDEEKKIGFLIERTTGIPARGTLEGEHLNTTYGYIGAEQHLPRFPGDHVGLHDEFQESGVTPATGAWSYFAPNQAQLTPEDIEREKYYLAVQTLYLPDWNTNWRHLKEWYRYRKMIVVNPDNGQAAVAVVADAGPAAWTGKHFGGSPEVMNILGGRRYKKGRVLMFFVDDPENKIPLGPVKWEREEEASTLASAE